MNTDAKNFNNILATKFNNTLKTSSTMIKLVSFWDRDVRMVQHTQINKHNTCIDKNHTIISIYAENVFDKTQHSFMIKALIKLGIEGTYLNLKTVIYDKPIDSIVLNGEKVKAFPLKLGMRQRCPLSTLTPT
jgi:hypothetical protein